MENEQQNKQASNKLYRSFDLFIIIPSSLLTLLCLIAAVATEETIPRVVSLLTAAAFLAVVPLLYIIRKASRSVSFVTKHGVAVVLGKKHRPSKEEIEDWTKSAMQFWSELKYKDTQGRDQEGFVYKGKTFQFKTGQIEERVARTTAFFKDGPIANFYSVYNRLLHGASWGEDIWIAMEFTKEDKTKWDKARSANIFRHELSHNILASLAPELPFTNEDNHAVFRENGLGA